MKHKVARFLVLSLAALSPPLAVLAGDLNYSDKVEFEKSMARNCYKTQRGQKINAGFSDSQIRDYCNCVSRETSETLSYDEIVLLIKTKSTTDETITIVENASEVCMEHLLEKWGYQ